MSSTVIFDKNYRHIKDNNVEVSRLLSKKADVVMQYCSVVRGRDGFSSAYQQYVLDQDIREIDDKLASLGIVNS